MRLEVVSLVCAALRYIKVLVEVAETGEAQIIIAGTYQWQFPVMVESSESEFNVLHNSKCIR